MVRVIGEGGGEGEEVAGDEGRREYGEYGSKGGGSRLLLELGESVRCGRLRRVGESSDEVVVGGFGDL